MRENFDEVISELAAMLLKQAGTPPEPVEQPSPDTEGEYYYPNVMGRGLLVATEEVLGKEDFEALLIMAGLQELIGNYPPNNLEKAFSFESTRRFAQALYEAYGSRGTQAIVRQTWGRGMPRFMEEMLPRLTKLGRAATRSGPLDSRLKVGLEMFLRVYNAVTDQITELDESDDYWIWRITRCGNCWGWAAEEPVCHLQLGALLGALGFFSGGRQFRIAETECIAMGGDSCTFLISKTPIAEEQME
jgi:predicted hydrocarbon binding protein